jgi:hypothetical protein
MLRASFLIQRQDSFDFCCDVAIVVSNLIQNCHQDHILISRDFDEEVCLIIVQNTMLKTCMVI